MTDPFVVPAGAWPRMRYWGLRLLEFGTVQAVVQLLTAIAGMLIVRHLTKPEYARYAILGSMVVASNALADLGIGMGLQSIGGRVHGDRERFDELVATALRLRRRFATGSLALCVPVGAWMLYRTGATPATILVLSLTLIVAVIPLLGHAVWLRVAQLDSAYRQIQVADLMTAALRLALVAAMAVSRMTAVLVTIVTAIANWVQLWAIRGGALAFRPHVDRTSESDAREMLALSRRSLPNALFYSFQGQITLVVLSAVGSVTGMADLTALGRLATILSVLSATFINVLAPRFIRCQDPLRLRRLYVLLLAGASAILVPLAFIAWMAPDPFLWLLGAKYQNLRTECGWVVTAGCVSQFGGVMAVLNGGKAWIWVQARAYVPVALVVLAVAGAVLDLHQFHDVLILNLVTVCIPLPMYAIDAVIGLRREAQAFARQRRLIKSAQP